MTNTDPHQNAVLQLEEVAIKLREDYEQPERFDRAVAKLKEPDNLIEGELEIQMDDGTSRKFQAYRSQHNKARGPYKGGVRFHQDVSLSEVKALSTWMTWKCAVTGIPYGGGKGGVIVNPRELSQSELQKLSRAYVRLLGKQVGPWQDIPAPDVNTNGQTMAWFIDEYEQMLLESGEVMPDNPIATFTGKPLELGGSQGREEATGLGGVFILEKLAAAWDKKPQDLSVAIQGFGNVGYWFAQHAADRGYNVVAVSGSQGGVYNIDGIDPAQALISKKVNGNFNDFGLPVSNSDLLELDVDVLVPAALENVITSANADNIKAKAIIEMANGPVTPDADPVLADRGIQVVPDILANAGGVTTSYFEWVQNLHGYYWSRDEVLAKLQPLMEAAFDQMWQLQQAHQVDGRTAAYMTAVKRVVDAMMLRGHI